jgi:hypothetical protein
LSRYRNRKTPGWQWRKLWREADEASKKGGNNTTGGSKQRMSLEELTKHLKDKSVKSIQE